MQTYSDVIIVGGGVIGCALALALAQHTTLSIALIDCQSPPDAWDKNHVFHRVSAINLASKRTLEHLNCWPMIVEKRISPFQQISIWDTKTQTELHFHAEEIAQDDLGYIVENNVLHSVLLKAVQAAPSINYQSQTKLVKLKLASKSISLISETGHVFQGKVAIACDGARSWLTKQSGIKLEVKAYHEQAIVCHVRTEKRHQQIARQVFTDDGPLAFLPLTDPHLNSIVWSLPNAKAEQLMHASDLSFASELQVAFGEQLGIVSEVTQRYLFPLQQQCANNYIAERIALVGDAAHVVHPLAGQGINIGLLDAASLADVIINAWRARRDLGGEITLRKYERWRRAENSEMIMGIDGLHAVFTVNAPLLNSLRGFGLQILNKLPLLKKPFIRYAVGERSRASKLARP